eukprot:comp23704_c0_seq1/m.40741 comp23704_c0_seq1/g.40741  ORF comp23704_c0_seq1/g.40741 comp23704_c0_seq1/m.40741 type:complete len:622 (-) comp23704_c0_seq1:650-2515(-)
MCGTKRAAVEDPSSFANFDVCLSKSLHMDLFVDFDRNVLDGDVVIEVEAQKDNVTELVLDTRNLTIHDVTDDKDEPLKYRLVAPEKEMGLGKALHVELPAALSKGQRCKVKVRYVTSPKAFAIQWLKPEQTAGKRHPYLFTQCEAVHARSMVPCQDTPAAKTTYTASITVPKELVALMSAVSTGESETSIGMKKYEFDQKVPVPAYLIALAVGDLHRRDISPRCAVWSEIEMVDKALYEFADTEQFLQKAEEVCGPYVWGRYDLLVLPPSFPFGGMENPCLTFVTPTLLAGDRSLVNVVAHEIAHSWTGNLVTNATWEHFWINEGFTVFVERKIIQRMHGEAHRHFHAILGWHALSQTIGHMGEKDPLTKLVVDLKEVHPDDSFSTVPYEKGFNLLFHCETAVGGPSKFEPYLRAHLEHFMHMPITTDDWLQYMFEYFKGDAMATAGLEAIDWKTWLYAPGMPPVDLPFDTSLADAANKLADRWAVAQPYEVNEQFSSNDVNDFVASQKVVFLSRLAEKDPIPHRVLSEMDKMYGFTASENAEIKCAWHSLCLKSNYEPIFPHVVAFVTSQGRMKYVRPLYRALYGAGIKGRQLAVETFQKFQGMYHPIAQAMVAKDLKLA